MFLGSATNEFVLLCAVYAPLFYAFYLPTNKLLPFLQLLANAAAAVHAAPFGSAATNILVLHLWSLSQQHRFSPFFIHGNINIALLFVKNAKRPLAMSVFLVCRPQSVSSVFMANCEIMSPYSASLLHISFYFSLNHRCHDHLPHGVAFCSCGATAR